MQITTRGIIGPYPCILASLLSRFLLSRTQHARLLARSCREGMRGDEEYRDPPRVAHEKATTFALLHPDFGRKHPLAHCGDLLWAVELHCPVAQANPARRSGRAQANPARRSGRYALAAPDVESEVVVVAAAGHERGRAGD